MRTDSSLTRKTVNLASGDTGSYYTGGSGQRGTVVLLHGGGTDHALLSWRETCLELIQTGYRVFAPDYPGYGHSPPAKVPATVENLLLYVEEMVTHWQLSRAVFVGISLGGALALGYALSHPLQIAGLVLVGTYGIQDRAPYHAISALYLKIPGLNSLTWALMRRLRWAARYTLNSIVRNPKQRTEALVDEVMAAMQNHHSQKAFYEFQRDEIQWQTIKTDYSSRLQEIEVPVLLIHGTHDIGVPVHYARQAASLIPHARLEVIEGAGHWTQRDEPECFFKLILEFLSELRISEAGEEVTP